MQNTVEGSSLTVLLLRRRKLNFKSRNNMPALLQDLLKRIPKVDKTLEWPDIKALQERYSKPEVLASIRLSLENLRDQIKNRIIDTLPDRQEIISSIISELARRTTSSLQSVINGTGIVIH